MRKTFIAILTLIFLLSGCALNASDPSQTSSSSVESSSSSASSTASASGTSSMGSSSDTLDAESSSDASSSEVEEEPEEPEVEEEPENNVEVERGAETENGTPFYNVMGYDGFIREHDTMEDVWTMRSYYVVLEDGTETQIAESFGFIDDGWSDYSVDLDGDGVTELICNVTYGGDGARRVYVYQRREDGIYLGTLNWGTPPEDLYDTGVNDTSEHYDPEDGTFYIQYSKANDETGVWSTQSMEDISFARYPSEA